MAFQSDKQQRTVMAIYALGQRRLAKMQRRSADRGELPAGWTEIMNKIKGAHLDELRAVKLEAAIEKMKREGLRINSGGVSIGGFKSRGENVEKRIRKQRQRLDKRKEERAPHPITQYSGLVRKFIFKKLSVSLDSPDYVLETAYQSLKPYARIQLDKQIERLQGLVDLMSRAGKAVGRVPGRVFRRKKKGLPPHQEPLALPPHDPNQGA